ncbi:hypothetical protein [Clavibacter californiensis]|nr:hypothetical protein [Clavibacter californiensis]UKF79682.1 hypothetical protein FGD68_12935 [Clavibacter californiensis]
MTDPADAPRHPLAEPARIDADSIAELAEAAEEDARDAAADPVGEGPDDI